MFRPFITTTAFALFTLLTIGCNVVQTPSSAPGVLVTAPPSASVYTVGETVAVQSTSTDPANILRVALVVDGVIVREDSSPVAIGQQQFSVVQTWTADKVGQHNLIVRATNGQGVTTDAGIYITVQAAPTDAATATVPINTATPINTAPIAPATLALPPLPTQNPAITVVVTATPVDTATLAPATLAPPANTATATRTLAPKTLAPEATTAAATTAAVATAVPPTAAPPLPNATGCSGQPAAFTFTASKSTITAGQSVTLNWGAVNNASIAVLNGGAFNALGVAAPGTVTASPTTTTTYTLTATCNNGGGTRNASVTVNVTAPAAAQPTTSTCVTANVTSFTASAETIASGNSVTLSWVTQGADTTMLRVGNGNAQVVPASGSQQFTPTQTTGFSVSVHCNARPGITLFQLSKTITVTPPVAACAGGATQIVSFTASAETVTAGDSVTLSWNVIGADDISLLASGFHIADHLEPSGSRTLPVLQTTAYNLLAKCKATGAADLRPLAVTATGSACSGIPSIGSFAADKNPVNKGDTTTLQWSGIQNADEIKLSGPPLQGAGSLAVPVPAVGSFTVDVPTNLGTITALGYTLTARCTVSNTGAERKVIITVNP